MDILVSYRGIPWSPGWATGDSVCRAIKQLGHNAYPYGNYYSVEGQGGKGKDLCGKALGAIPRNIDAVLWLECNDADPQYTELDRLGVPMYLWEFDTAMHLDFSEQLYQLMRFKKIFLANFFVNEELKTKYPTEFLPYAADPELFYPSEHVKKTDELALIGTAFQLRERWCAEHNVKLISNIYREAYRKKLQSLRGHVHFFDSGGRGLVVMRPFETFACKTCLITEKNYVLEAIGYKFKRDYISLDLYDPMNANYIAANGFAKTLRYHTYKHRVARIIEVMQGAK